jgi:hypothetical protein
LKKYTLQVEALDDSVTADHLKTAIENILLRLHPRITYHLGLVSNTGSSSFFAEIASDGKKDLLEAHLHNIQDKLPVRVERLGWGWITKDAMNLSKDHAPQPSEAKARSFLLNANVFPLRYILSISLILALLLVLIARFYFDWSLFLDSAFQFLFTIWLFSTTEIPLDIRLYVQHIDCDLAELVVVYSFKKKTICMSWETIEGLEYQNMIYMIHRRDNIPIRFYMNKGFKERHALLATITQRASLNEVESGIGKAVYKRYDAS